MPCNACMPKCPNEYALPTTRCALFLLTTKTPCVASFASLVGQNRRYGHGFRRLFGACLLPAPAALLRTRFTCGCATKPLSVCVSRGRSCAGAGGAARHPHQRHYAHRRHCVESCPLFSAGIPCVWLNPAPLPPLPPAPAAAACTPACGRRLASRHAGRLCCSTGRDMEAAECRPCDGSSSCVQQRARHPRSACLYYLQPRLTCLQPEQR